MTRSLLAVAALALMALNAPVARAPFVLHLWRKHGFNMPMPPKEFV